MVFIFIWHYFIGRIGICIQKFETKIKHIFFVFVTAKLLKSQDGNLFFARVKTGQSGT